MEALGTVMAASAKATTSNRRASIDDAIRAFNSEQSRFADEKTSHTRVEGLLRQTSVKYAKDMVDAEQGRRVKSVTALVAEGAWERKRNANRAIRLADTGLSERTKEHPMITSATEPIGRDTIAAIKLAEDERKSRLAVSLRSTYFTDSFMLTILLFDRSNFQSLTSILLLQLSNSNSLTATL